MTIKEVSEKYDLTPDTLRYYEKVGLLNNVPRNASGIRDYDNKTLKKIEFIKCMRSSGVEIEVLLKYMNLMSKGKSTSLERKKLLEDQRVKLLDKKKNIEDTLERLNYKIEVYQEILDGKRKDFTEE